MLLFCWNPAVLVLLVLVRRPLVPRPPYFFVSCGWHHQKVVAETSQVVVSLALGIFTVPIDLDCKPLLECSCFIPGDVENEMTAFSLTTRDVVEPVHLFCHSVYWHTLVSGRGGPTMGTSFNLH